RADSRRGSLLRGWPAVRRAPSAIPRRARASARRVCLPRRADARALAPRWGPRRSRMTAKDVPPTRLRRNLRLAAGAVIAALATAVIVLYWPRAAEPVVSAPLPPLTESPFLNTWPGVA